MTCTPTIQKSTAWARAALVFVGYDSAMTHGVSCSGATKMIQLSSGAPSSTYRQRWTPWGVEPVVPISVDDQQEESTRLDRIKERLRTVESDGLSGLDDDDDDD